MGSRGVGISPNISPELFILRFTPSPNSRPSAIAPSSSSLHPHTALHFPTPTHPTTTRTIPNNVRPWVALAIIAPRQVPKPDKLERRQQRLLQLRRHGRGVVQRLGQCCAPGRVGMLRI
ncbi:hypothetical protein BC938DRAFT_472085 [Jimgerdemannia flammicorona]|uniref:Uncharacterized protein n=1 Tax=Jimgerdemannia flammicorona TaxID=994334 RepID=A0A433Q6W1_9FUNG|nr:hypothetical protein BC938DRAFT_472085 [Jimgerdemannia flammicorona]